MLTTLRPVYYYQFLAKDGEILMTTIINDLPFHVYLSLGKYGLEGFDIPEATHTHWLLYFKCQKPGCCERCDYDHCDCRKGPPLSVNW